MPFIKIIRLSFFSHFCFEYDFIHNVFLKICLKKTKRLVFLFHKRIFSSLCSKIKIWFHFKTFNPKRSKLCEHIIQPVYFIALVVFGLTSSQKLKTYRFVFLRTTLILGIQNFIAGQLVYAKLLFFKT